MRAAQHIAWDSKLEPVRDPEKLLPQVSEALRGLAFDGNPIKTADGFREAMSRYGAHSRDISALKALDAQLSQTLEAANKPFDCIPEDMEARLRLKDQLVTQRVVISAMTEAAQVYGSTGAGLVLDAEGRPLPHIEHEENLVLYTQNTNGGYITVAEPARPIPRGEQWFETVWKKFRVRTGKQ
jgi:hypothetical protein